jgi:hypothetical protein
MQLRRIERAWGGLLDAVDPRLGYQSSNQLLIWAGKKKHRLADETGLARC